MGTVNKATVIGFLGRDPEIRTFGNGGKAANLRIATTRAWKDRTTGERVEETEWHHVNVVADGLVGVAEKYLKKGSMVYIMGRLKTRKWTDRDGVERYSTEIVVGGFDGELTLLDRRGQGPDRGDAQGGGASSPPPSGPPPSDLDDEIPF